MQIVRLIVMRRISARRLPRRANLISQGTLSPDTSLPRLCFPCLCIQARSSKITHTAQYLVNSLSGIFFASAIRPAAANACGSPARRITQNEARNNPSSACIRALQASLTYFSAKRVTTIQSLLARAIGRFLGWKTLRDQVSTLGTHDPGAVSFAEAAFRHLSPSVVPWKNISGVVLGVFADHSVRHDTISAYGSYVSLSCMQSMEVTAF